MDPQERWLLQKERTLAWLRVGFSLMAVLVVQLNPERITSFPILSRFSLLSFVAYSLAVLSFLVRRNSFNIAKLALITTVLDMLWVSMIVLSTGPFPTPFFVYYSFPVVTSSSRYGVKGGMITGSIGVVLYGILRLSPFSSNPVPIDIFLIRGVYLLALAYIFGFLSEFEQKQNQKLVALYKTAGEAAAREERSRIARELHDRLLQTLATLSLRLEACRKHLTAVPSELSTELRLMEDMAAQSMVEIRQFLSGKNVPFLAPGTLIERIKDEMQFLRDGLGIDVIFETEPEEINLSPAVEQELYYVLREGLINIASHSNASRAAVRFNETERRLSGIVEDDGIGFDMIVKEGNGGFGLRSMEERINRLGGNLTIQTAPGKGTRLTFSLPLG